jgi:hypothetical protein
LSEDRPWSDRPDKPAELTDLGAEQQHSSEGQEQATVDLLTDTEEQLRAKVLASSAKYTVAGNCFPGHKPLTWTVDSLTVDDLHLGPGVMASIGTVTFVVIVIMIRLSALALEPYRYALVATWTVGQRVIGDVYWCEARVLHHVPDGTDLVGPEATEILRFYNQYLSGRDFPNWKVSKPFFRSGRQRYQVATIRFQLCFRPSVPGHPRIARRSLFHTHHVHALSNVRDSLLSCGFTSCWPRCPCLEW